MDEQCRQFIRKHSGKLQGKVLEVGSLNVNGGIRDIIDITVGCDMRAGPGVDIVCPVENLKDHYADGHFDACVSLNALEHIEDWRGFFRVTWDLVKEGGWIVLTMASLKKGRHNHPNDYWRMTEEHIKTVHPGCEWAGNVSPASIGWAVQKQGDLGSLDFEPIKVK